MDKPHKQDKPHKLKVLEAVLVQPPVEGRTGEVLVTVRNSEDRMLDAHRMMVRELTEGTSKSARRFAVIPSEDHDGYRLKGVAPIGEETRTFCLRPVDADVGSETRFEVVVELEDSKLRAEFSVRVLARPEVYAAIGAVEWLREHLLHTYERMQQKGRAKQEQMEVTWPSAEAMDTARVALGEESFQRVFEAIQLGARIIDGIARKSGGGSS